MQQTNPREAVALLEVFRICVTNRVMTTQRIIDWADAIIQRDAAPDDFIVDLAMCGSKNINAMISLLNEYIGEKKPSAAGKATLGFLYNEYSIGKIEMYRVARTIDWLVWNSDFTEEERSFMYGVDDEYSLSAEGVRGPVAASVAAVEDYILRFLECYQDFRLDNSAEWGEINVIISAKVKARYKQLKSSW